MPTFLATDRAQSSVVGYALVIGLVATAVVTTVTLGGAALSDAQDESAVSRAEQTMTLFDSQTAQVALGDSSVHTIGLGGTQGTYQVEPTAGSISIVQLDCDDGNADGDDDNNDDNDDVVDNPGSNDLDTEDDAYVMDPVDLGRMSYTSGQTTLAYEGGGVWRKDRDGEARMISPPEFHYRGATLTLPIVLTRGSTGGSGPGTTATVTAAGDPVQVFPRAGNFPSRCGGESLTNPVEDGNVYVQVESSYYRAWGDYFEARTDGKVVYLPAEEKVRVKLISLAQVGAFEMPGEGGAVPVSGAAGEHSVEEFSIRLRPDETDSADFNNLQWSLYAENGDQRFEVHLKKSGSGGCSGGSTGITADMTIYYSDDGGTTYHGWKKEDAYNAQCADLNGDGDDEIFLEATFVDDDDSDGNPENAGETDVALDYVSLSQDDLLFFKPDGTPADPTLDGHGGDADVSWEPETYTDDSAGSGKTQTVDRLFNHYFAEFPEEFDLVVDDKNSDSINEGGSSGELFTGGSDRYVTYIHVTQNEVTVEID